MDFLSSMVTAVLILINCAVFLLETLAGGSTKTEVALKFGAQYEPLIRQGQYYRLFTAMFLHFGLAHLANNMICMLFIGDMVETAVGPVRYLVVCLGGGLLGNLCSMWWELRTGRFAFSAGASGCVFALIGAMLVLMAGARRIGAGSLVTQGTEIPDGSLVLGSPAKVIRPVNEKDIQSIIYSKEAYLEKGKKAKEGIYEY